MADEYATAFQKGLIAHLDANAPLVALVGGRIYDEPPDSAVRPYLRINDIEPRPVRSDCGRAFEIVFSLEAHSRPLSGRVEATRVLEAAEAALESQTFAVEGYTVVYVRHVAQTLAQDNDGEGYTGVIAFEALLDRT